MAKPVHYEFHAPSGRVRVTIDRPARVRLLDNANFRRYLWGARFSYVGGRHRPPVVEFTVPEPGRWHILIESDDGPVRSHAELVGENGAGSAS